MTRAYLVLKDGKVFRGKPLGAIGESEGEVVFNTSLTGYQEILTDPSYAGQMVTMTYPLIGNYGVNEEDVESRAIASKGFIIKEESRIPCNWRSTMSLGDYLRKHNIVGIQGIDTRALTRRIRESGSMPGIISSDGGADIGELKERASKLAGTEGRDLVSQVTCEKSFDWNEGTWDLTNGYSAIDHGKYKVVAIDLGVKLNILRNLKSSNVDVTVVPAQTTAEEILALNPDGLFISNGPGDPSAVPGVAVTVKGLIGKLPIFGICLGHQILCIALGGESYKLKFGHHGGNQPVIDLATRKIEITSQNHNYAVREDSLPDDVEITHKNLNDNTIEGIRSESKNFFSVQYHPEAAPGPNDANHLFGRFVAMMGEA